jgi:hypothetical protein
VLNIAAVGLSLGAIVSEVFSLLFDRGPSPFIGPASGVSTLVVGSLWALLLRSRKTLWKWRVPIGWVAAVPLASFNAALALGLMAASKVHPHSGPIEIFTAAAVGATFGAIIWMPALVATLILFGLPLYRARDLARRGLAGEEGGEKLVGAVCAFVGALALFAALEAPHGPTAGVSSVTIALGVLGSTTGAMAAILAWAREDRRRAFVARAEAGREAGYRVEPTPQGKVLMRISSQGEGYRVADFEERVAELGDRDEVTRVAG